MGLEEHEKISIINKTYVQINQVMEVARAPMAVPMKNDDQYIWIAMQAIVFFEIILCENQTFCLL